MSSRPWLPHNDLTPAERAELVAGVEGLCRLIGRKAYYTWPAAGEVDDFCQHARMGAMHAAELFRTELGNRFTTYATRWIRQACRRFGLGNGVVRTPEHVMRDRDFEPPIVNQDLVPERIKVYHDPAERLEDAERREMVESCLACLPFERDRQVMLLRFGLGDRVEMSLAEIARELGITRERVRQIEQRSLERIRSKILLQ